MTKLIKSLFLEKCIQKCLQWSLDSVNTTEENSTVKKEKEKDVKF